MERRRRLRRPVTSRVTMNQGADSQPCDTTEDPAVERLEEAVQWVRLLSLGVLQWIAGHALSFGTHSTTMYERMGFTRRLEFQQYERRYWVYGLDLQSKASVGTDQA